jgi:hypothetical protein
MVHPDMDMMATHTAVSRLAFQTFDNHAWDILSVERFPKQLD